MQDRITTGDTLNYATTVADYPASAGWTLHYRLIPRATGSAIDLTATTDPDNADGYVVQATAAATAVWTAGEYSWASWITKALESYSLGSGTCTLLPNPRTATGPFDNRTPARIALDDALVAQRTWTPSTKRYRIGEREMEFNSPGDIERHISVLTAQVTREERMEASAKGYPDKRKTYVRMANA